MVLLLMGSGPSGNEDNKDVKKTAGRSNGGGPPLHVLPKRHRGRRGG